jgi:hypothetical protein
VSVTVLPTSAVQLLPEQLEPAVPSLAATDPSADGEALPVTVPWAITTALKVAVSESAVPVVVAATIVHWALVPADAPHVPPVQPANVKLLLVGLAVSVTVSAPVALHVTVVPAGPQLPLTDIVPLIVPPVPPVTVAVTANPVPSAMCATGTDRR